MFVADTFKRDPIAIYNEWSYENLECVLKAIADNDRDNALRELAREMDLIRVDKRTGEMDYSGFYKHCYFFSGEQKTWEEFNEQDINLLIVRLTEDRDRDIKRKIEMERKSLRK